MVKYRRNFVPGATFFFTVNLEHRNSTYLTDNITLLRESFRKTRFERPFTIDAIVILPEHLHAILTLPECDTDFPHRWRRIKSVFTRSLIRKFIPLPARDKTGRRLWQRRFWEHTIYDDTDFARHVDYIHYNPVKHGLVTAPIQWPHSSLHRFIRQGTLPNDWGGPTDDGSYGEP
jgi:putative transposase